MADYDSESDYDSDSGSDPYSDYVHEEQAVFRAVRAFDVEALRRCLAAGADPDMFEDDNRHSTLLYDAVYYCSARRDMDFLIQERTSPESGHRTIGVVAFRAELVYPSRA